MSREQLWRDVENLAGHQPHRGGVTENERRAAEYLLGRFRESTSLSQIEDFYSPEGQPYLFAMYFGEFFFVALIAGWFPWIMMVYGLAVFLAYMAEITGYRVFSRLLPQYETQNVSARLPCEEAKRLLVFTAHYDSPRTAPWRGFGSGRGVRYGQLIVVASMLAVIVSCGAEGLNVFEASAVRWDLIVRWPAVAVLLVAALALYTGARRSEHTPGAINNASGAAVLIALGERLKVEPLESTEVWLVATGSKETWLSGMRQLFRGLDIDKRRAFFLNIAGVGSGKLRYVTGEGMLHLYRASKTMVGAARDLAGDYAAEPVVYRGPATDALIPLTRGYQAMSVMGTGDENVPEHAHQASDTVSAVDLDALEQSVGFVEAIARKLDTLD